MDTQFGKKIAGPDEAAIEAFSAAGLAKGKKIRACLTCHGRGDCEECESTEDFDSCYAIYRSRHAGAAGAGAGAAAAAGPDTAPHVEVKEVQVHGLEQQQQQQPQ